MSIFSVFSPKLFKKGMLVNEIPPAGSGGGGAGWFLDGNTNSSQKYIGTNNLFDFPIYANGLPNVIAKTTGNFQVNGIIEDGGGSVSIAPTNHQLYDSSGTTSVDWETKFLKTTNNTVSIDWENLLLFDSTSQTSIDWQARTLNDATGAMISEWSASGFNIGTANFGGAVVALSIHNATVVPSTNPVNGIVTYSEGGQLKYRDSSGNIITV